MNPVIKALILALSYKNELKFVFLSFLIALSIPFIAVFLLTQSGIDLISDKLVTKDPQQQQTVDIHDPATGSVVNQVKASVVWPVHGVITLEFGESDLPYQLFHTGIDIANSYGRVGDQITPFMAGTVKYAGEIFWGYGKHIVVDHGNHITSIYGHLDKIYVIPGEKVIPGQIIGREGETGWATGPHLHFQINVYGIPVNPRTFLTGNP